MFVFQALRTGHCPRAGCEAPSCPPSLTVRDTINAVYCLCLIGSQQEMACKKLFVWRGLGRLNETSLLPGPRMDGVFELNWAKTSSLSARQEGLRWDDLKSESTAVMPQSCTASPPPLRSSIQQNQETAELSRCVYSTRDVEHFWRGGVDTQSERTEATSSADELCNTASFFLLFIGEISLN